MDSIQSVNYREIESMGHIHIQSIKIYLARIGKDWKQNIIQRTKCIYHDVSASLTQQPSLGQHAIYNL